MSVSPVTEQHDHHHCESYCYLDDCYCCYCYKVSAHYANGGHSFNSPVTVSPADLHTYQLGRPGSGGSASNSQQMTTGGVMMASPNMTGHMPGEGQEVSKKRELRLLKNRWEMKYHMPCFWFPSYTFLPEYILLSVSSCYPCITCATHYPLFYPWSR